MPAHPISAHPIAARPGRRSFDHVPFAEVQGSLALDTCTEPVVDPLVESVVEPALERPAAGVVPIDRRARGEALAVRFEQRARRGWVCTALDFA